MRWSGVKLFAEKLQAIASPWADYVNELDMKYISINGGLASHVEFDMKRGRTFQNLASMLYCCQDVDLRRTPSAIHLERWLNELPGPSRTFKFRMERMLSNLLLIASDKALDKAFTGFSAKVSPAEFVFIGMWSLPQPSGVQLMHLIRRCPTLRDARRRHGLPRQREGSCGPSLSK
jgi:hypothetical protein